MMENLKELFRLVKENPDLEVIPMVDSECVADDGYSWWLAGVGTPRVDEYYKTDDRVYLKYDFEDLVDEFMDNNCDDLPLSISEDADLLWDHAKKAVSAYPWIKAILLPITP